MPLEDEDCQPRYIDLEHLLAKANSICTRYTIHNGQVNDAILYEAFYIVDTAAIQADWVAPKVVAIVRDPNLLLPILERLCISDITPWEFLLSN
jgi:hypothetical protein